MKTLAGATGWRVALLVFLGVLNVVLFIRMVWGPSGLLEYRAMRHNHAALEQKLAELDKANVALSREIRMLQSDRTYVEKMIRQRLRYVRDGEVIYLFSEPSTGAAEHDGKN